MTYTYEQYINELKQKFESKYPGKSDVFDEMLKDGIEYVLVFLSDDYLIKGSQIFSRKLNRCYRVIKGSGKYNLGFLGPSPWIVESDLIWKYWLRLQ